MIDLHAYLGLGGLTIIESAVEYIVTHSKIPRDLAPALAIGFGILINLALAFNFHTDLYSSILIGAVTGLLASGWHEVTK